MKEKSSKSIYKTIVKMWNAGIKDKEKIMKYVNRSRDTINFYLRKGRKEGLIPKEESKFDIVIKKYKEGITSVTKIAELTGINYNAVERYLVKARKEGIIPKYVSKYQQLLYLYNVKKITKSSELAKELDLTLDEVYHYVWRARKRGEIEKKPTNKYMEVIKLVNNGVSEDEIKKLTGLSTKVLYTYIKRGTKRGHIIIKREINKEELIEELKGKYPCQIARERNLKISEVYNLIEKLSKKQKKEVLIDSIKIDPLQKEISNITKNKFGQHPLNSMLQIYEERKEKYFAQLLRVCYSIGQYDKNTPMINSLIIKLLKYKCKNKNADKALQKEKVLVAREIKVQELRKQFRKTWYDTDFIRLCKNLKVTSEFAQEAVGGTTKPNFDKVKNEQEMEK